MKIQTQFNFKDIKVEDATYSFTAIADNEQEAKQILVRHLKKVVQDLET